MNKTTLTRLFFLLISAVLAFTLFSIPFRGGVAATPIPESKSNEQIAESEALTYINIFYSLADADITQGFPTENSGTDGAIIVGYDDEAPRSISRGLIYFNIASLPSNQNILGATLRINYVDYYWGSDTPQKITTYRIPSNWVEGTVTWNNKPDYGESYGSQSIHGNAYGWYEFDVTNLVRGWYDGTYSNYGIMLRGVESDGIDASYRSFSTRESELDPELIIQYEPNPSAPTISGLPDQELLVDTNLNNAIDLWAYASDAEDVDSALSFTINNTPNSSAGVSIDSNRYIDINPSSGWTGVTNVEIKVTDTVGLSNTDSFQVEVTGGSINTPPTISGLPDKDIKVNTTLNNAIDLWAYASDVEDSDSELSFIINNNPNPGAGISIDSNRYVDINPASGWTGVTNVAIEVMDTDGYSDLDSFQVKVISDTNTSAPSIAGLPDKELLVDTSLDNAIDLWAYTYDAEDPDADLSFTINNNPNPGAGISIDSNRYVYINPASGWTGVTNVAIEVMDTDGYSDLDSFQVRIFGEIEIINLPIVHKH